MDQQQDHQHQGQDGRQNGDQGSQATSHNSSPFGRGWIPLSRDIGIPGERLARNQQHFAKEGDAEGDAWGVAGCADGGGPLDGVAEDCRRLGAWAAVEGVGFGADGVVDAAAHPQPLPPAGGETGSALPRAGGGLDESWTPSLPSPSYTHWTAERQVRFLAFLAENGRVRHAAARVGMSFQSAYVARRRDAAFAQGWDAAMVLARDVAEQALADRAIEGVVETVWYRGEAVGHRRRFDSRLLLAHLARLDAHARSDAPGRAVAGRFDEYLAAMLAGEADPAERAPHARDWPATGWRPLDPDRPSAIAEAVREAESALIDQIDTVRAEAADALCAGLPLGDRPEKHAIEEVVEHRLHAAADLARLAAAAQWDAGFAHRMAGVDALMAADAEEPREGACADDFADDAATPAPIPAAAWTIEAGTEPRTCEFKAIDAATIGQRTAARTQMGAGIAPGPHDRSPLASHDFAFDHRVPNPDCFRGTKPLATVETGRSEPHGGPLPGRFPIRFPHPLRAGCHGPVPGPQTRTVSLPRPGPQRCLALAESRNLLCLPGWAPSSLHRPCGLGWALIFPLRRRSLGRDALQHLLRTAFHNGRIIPFASALDGLVRPPRSAVEFVHPEACGNRFPDHQTAVFRCSISAETDLPELVPDMPSISASMRQIIADFQRLAP